MRKICNWRLSIICVLTIIVIASVLAIPVMAAENELPRGDKDEVVYDMADLLTSREEKKLEEEIRQIRQYCDLNLVLITQESFKGDPDYIKGYAGKAYQNIARLGIGTDTIVFVISKYDNLEYFFVGESFSKLVSEEQIKSALGKYTLKRNIGNYRGGIENAIVSIGKNLGLPEEYFMGETFIEEIMRVAKITLWVIVGLILAYVVFKFSLALVREERRYKRIHKIMS